MLRLNYLPGPYFTDYDELELGTEPFRNLYKNRDWGLVQMAISVQY